MKNIIQPNEEVFIISNSKTNYTHGRKIKNIFVPILNSETKNPLDFNFEINGLANLCKKELTENRYGIYKDYSIVNTSYITLNIKDILYSQINKILNIKINTKNTEQYKMNQEDFICYINNLSFEDLYSDDINKIIKFIKTNKYFIGNNFFNYYVHLLGGYSHRNLNISILFENLNLFLSERDLSNFANLNNPKYLHFLLFRNVYSNSYISFIKDLDFLGNRNDIKNIKLLKKYLFSFFDYFKNKSILNKYKTEIEDSNNIKLKNIFKLDNPMTMPCYVQFYILLKFEDYLQQNNYNPPMDLDEASLYNESVVDFRKFYKEMGLDLFFKKLIIINENIEIDCKMIILFIINFINDKFSISKDHSLAQDFDFDSGYVSYILYENPKNRK